jgi:glycosyltransferase involved in cell wall biosynthesis
MTDNQTRATPVVSVGIPTYNRPEGLRRTLRCICEQSYKNIEIIVSDNCSPTPESMELVGEFQQRDPRVRFFRQQPSLGAFGNFQFVLQQAKGDFFMWAADDDEWHRDYIQECLCVFTSQDIASAMPHFKTLNRVSGQYRDNPMPSLTLLKCHAANMTAFLRVLSPSFFYGLHRREKIQFFLRESSVFDFYDCYFILRLLSEAKIAIVDQWLYTAGIDQPEYQIKTFRKRKMLSLSYMPFYKSCLHLVQNGIFSFKEKFLLTLILTITVVKLLIAHESLSRFKLKK